MSLNGLDNPDVQDAYQVAIAEAGGWFLLKYASRDSVELHGRGKNGVLEARAAIAKYEENSPLYGIIIYRRRKVVIKYIPEGTSRVLLARTAVHFQDVAEKYAPYETLLEIKTAEGLNDTSLAASFKLHTASPSASSSRLDEISEDAEDGGPPSESPASQRPPGGGYFSSQRLRMDRRPEVRSPALSSDGSSIGLSSVSRVSTAAPKKASVSQFLVRSDSGQQSITSLGTRTLDSMTEYEDTESSTKDTDSVESNVETPRVTSPPTQSFPDPPPLTSQPTSPVKLDQRPSTSAVPETRQVIKQAESPAERPTSAGRTALADKIKYDEELFELLKPKPKLGPRPVAAPEKTKRPTIASVSSMPATYRPTTAKKQEAPRPPSQGFRAAIGLPGATKGIPAPPPIPDVPEYNPRPLSRGSVKSLPSHKSTAMTPDKIRLMKAVELRKKQLRKSNPQAGTFVPPPEETLPEVPKVPDSLPPEKAECMSKKIPDLEDSTEDEGQASSKKADSGIEMEYGKTEQPYQRKETVNSKVDDSKTEPTEPLASSPGREVTPLPAQPLSEPERAEPVSSQNIRVVEVRQPTGLGLTVDSHPQVPPGDDQTSPDSPTLSPLVHSPKKTAPAEEEVSIVPTIVMPDGSRPKSSDNLSARSGDVSPADSEADQRNGYESAGSSNVLDIPEKSPRRQNSDLARRRRGVVEPIHIDGDTEFMSDDELMEELQSATLQEATPMIVSKSPIASYFPRRPSDNSARAVNIVGRASTMPAENFTDGYDRLSPGLPSEFQGHARAGSSPPTEQSDPLSSMNRRVSSGISRRIQALSESSSREGTPGADTSARPITPEMPSNGYFPKDQKRNSPRSRPGSYRAGSRQSGRMNSIGSQTAAFDQQQAGNGAPTWTVQRDATTNRESISVSARIVRPAGERTESATSEAEFQQSQLVINHKRASPSQPVLPVLPVLPRLDTNQSSLEPNFEPGPSRGSSPTMTRTSSIDYNRMHSNSKFGRHKNAPASPTPDDFPTPPPSSTRGHQRSTSNAGVDENAAPKESSRTSRFFKRMSNIGGKRKSGMNQSITNTSPVVERNGASLGSVQAVPEKPVTPPSVVVGDLNIQFPDSLLWKRRMVEIDETGSLIFSIHQAMEHQKGASKRYPLTDFRIPYVPDLDRQELPNSIMLDFIDGATLQIACEDTMTHKHVVHVLKTYWKAWSGMS